MFLSATTSESENAEEVKRWTKKRKNIENSYVDNNSCKYHNCRYFVYYFNIQIYSLYCIFYK